MALNVNWMFLISKPGRDHRNRKKTERMNQPLSRYKIMDCSRLLPYQYCTLLLGDLGAEVLKVEEPGRGDYGRWVDIGNPGKESLLFVMANRNKKSIVLDLKKGAGKEIFKKLAIGHDVILESFRPGVMERLGLGYQTIKEINPKIIYCSATGYGQTGPYKYKAGHDINYISIAGILGVSRENTLYPPIPSIPVADMVGGGVFPALTILAALLGRERTGKGEYIDVAMTDVATSLNILNIARALEEKADERMVNSNLLGENISYRIFRTKDQKFISLGDLEFKFWRNFCSAIGREDLIEKHNSVFQDGEETTESLKAIFSTKTQSEWVDLMRNVDSCFSPVLTPEQTLEDRHLLERGMIMKVQDPKRGETLQIGFPALFSNGLHYNRSPAPKLGEHTDEILEALGYRHKEIKALREEGVI
jgi:crotonobetainyl-CoA:carnitine CoA-transferase CaiB-like acyl-CoA transferase